MHDFHGRSFSNSKIWFQSQPASQPQTPTVSPTFLNEECSQFLPVRNPQGLIQPSVLVCHHSAHWSQARVHTHCVQLSHSGESLCLCKSIDRGFLTPCHSPIWQTHDLSRAPPSQPVPAFVSIPLLPQTQPYIINTSLPFRMSQSKGLN